MKYFYIDLILINTIWLQK